MSGVIPVIACVVRRGGRYLVCRRPGHKRHGGMWEFPGGKVRSGESVRAAAARELREELGLEAGASWKEVATVQDPGSPYSIRFAEGSASGEPRRLEHSAVSWARPVDLLSFRLAPADLEFAASLTGSRGNGAADFTDAFRIAHEEAARCLSVWGLSDADFDPGVRLVFTRRMTRSLGCAYLERSRIHLSAVLARPRYLAVLREVVCHELAHLAALVGTGPQSGPRSKSKPRSDSKPRPRPHGPEWAAMITAVGYPARLYVPLKGAAASRREC